MIKRFANKFSTSFSNVVTLDIGDRVMVFVSGQVGMPPKGPPSVVTENFDEEARLCFRNVELALEQANATLKDLVRINVYLTRKEDYRVFDAVRDELLSSAPPASATVIVADLMADAHLEIDAIAVVQRN